MKKAFSLMELLVVMSIIGMLSAVLIPNLAGAQNRAKEAALRALLYNVQAEIEGCYLDNNYYPAGESTPLAQLANELGLKRFRNPFTGKEYLASDQAGRIMYSLDSSLGVYTLTAYKKDGVTELLELTNN
jgi:prepilin-type N-terminal cleavage/methylation domain-containing protein